MSKYFNVIKMVILEKLQYIYSQIGGIFIYLLFIYVFMQLWNYMYNGDNLIAGYTLSQMVWYVAVTEIIWSSIRPKSIKRELSIDIRSGKIAYILNKPFNYICYLLSKYIGESIVIFLLHVISGIIIGILIIGGLTTFTLISIPFIIITTILAALITAFIYILISLSAFWIEDNNPFFWIYEKLILAVGVMFPLEVFPVVLQPFIKFSPVYVTMYSPAKMVVDFSMAEFINVFVFQLGYLLISIILCLLVYSKGVKKLNVNGG